MEPDNQLLEKEIPLERIFGGVMVIVWVVPKHWFAMEIMKVNRITHSHKVYPLPRGFEPLRNGLTVDVIVTLRRSNSSPLKNGGWETTLLQ